MDYLDDRLLLSSDCPSYPHGKCHTSHPILTTTFVKKGVSSRRRLTASLRHLNAQRLISQVGWADRKEKAKMRTLVMFWIGWFVKKPKIKFRCNVGMVRDPSSVIPGFRFSGKRVRPYWYSHINSAQCHQRFFLSSCQLSGMMTELSKLVLLHFFPTPWDLKPFCCLHQSPLPLSNIPGSGQSKALEPLCLPE